MVISLVNVIFDPNGTYLRPNSLYFRHSGMLLAGIQPVKL